MKEGLVVSLRIDPYERSLVTPFIDKLVGDRVRKEGLSLEALMAGVNRSGLDYQRALTALARNIHPNASFHDLLHSLEVPKRAVKYLEAAGCPEPLIRLIELAMILHDAGHNGFRYREEAPGFNRFSESNEEFAARIFVSTFPHLNATQLWYGVMIILGTSFGQNNPELFPTLRLKPWLQRPYTMFDGCGEIAHFADINATPGTSGFGAYHRGGVQIAFENGLSPAFEKYLHGQLDFLRYITSVAERVGHYWSAEYLAGVLAEIADVEERTRAIAEGKGEPDDLILITEIIAAQRYAPVSRILPFAA